MPENNIPTPQVEGAIPGSIATAVHDIFDQVFSDETLTPETAEPTVATGTVVTPDTPAPINTNGAAPVVTEEPKPEETEEEPKPEETEEEEQKEGDDEEQKPEDDEPKAPRTSKAAGKAFAEMRVQLKTAKREADDLRRQLEEAKNSTPDNEELESLRNIVKGYAYTATDEYKEQVSGPYNKANAKITAIVQKAGAAMDLDKLNEVALNPDLDPIDRDDAYETIGTEAGLTGTDLARFVRMANVRDKAIAAHGKFQAEADKYVEELKASQGKNAEGKYEVNLDNYTLDNMKERAKELGITSEITEDNLKHARHLAHKLDNGSFMDRALTELMQKELLEARGTIEALEAKVKKLRGAAPRPSKGDSAPPEVTKPTDSGNVTDIIRGAFDLLR